MAQSGGGGFRKFLRGCIADVFPLQGHGIFETFKCFVAFDMGKLADRVPHVRGSLGFQGFDIPRRDARVTDQGQGMLQQTCR